MVNMLKQVGVEKGRMRSEENVQEKQKNCDNSRRSNVENGYVSKLLTGRLHLAQKNRPTQKDIWKKCRNSLS